jgi:formylglycine-generating enzyme required for sulfatase activity
MKKTFVLFIIVISGCVTLPDQNPAADSVHAPKEGLAFINGGTFTMGSPISEHSRHYSFNADDEKQRQITISSFYMGRTEVTQREYQGIMGMNPSYFKGENLPVEYVRWFEAVDYCNRLSLAEGLTPAYMISGSGNNREVKWDRSANGYRLPTEAEWEYACRSGTITAFNTGRNLNTRQANFDNHLRRTAEVGSYPSNAWGLYDMHGNVSEWCWDLFDDYNPADLTDPQGPSSALYNRRINRGGNWNIWDYLCRSAFRYANVPYDRGSTLGFRIARNME